MTFLTDGMPTSSSNLTVAAFFEIGYGVAKSDLTTVFTVVILVTHNLPRWPCILWVRRRRHGVRTVGPF